MANGKEHSITLDKITCQGTSDFSSGNDEVYILYQVDGGPIHRYPLLSAVPNTTSMNSDTSKGVNSWSPNLTIDFNYEVLVTLWDQDLTYVNTVSEFLVGCDYRPDNTPATFNMTNNNHANYTLSATYHG